MGLQTNGSQAAGADDCICAAFTGIERSREAASSDTPALESPAALAAVKPANLTIVPARPSPFDIWAAVVTGRRMNVLREKFVFLLNQCPKRGASRRMRASIAALEAAGPLLVQQIG